MSKEVILDTLPARLVWAMQLRFVNEGSSVLPDCKPLQSKYLRELTELAMDGNKKVYYPTISSGNYTGMTELKPDELRNHFQWLWQSNKWFFNLLAVEPEFLAQFKELYK